MAGYSGTPLAKKLGVKTGHRVVLLDAPDHLEADLAPLPHEVDLAHTMPAEGDLDVIVRFARSSADLADLPILARRLTPAGGLWVGWPKKASKVPTDLSFGVVQPAGLALGLVDNKTCAISEVFSGLRFVVRKEHRKAWAEGRRDLPSP